MKQQSYKEKKMSCKTFEMVWMGLKLIRAPTAKDAVKASGKTAVAQ